MRLAISDNGQEIGTYDTIEDAPEAIGRYKNPSEMTYGQLKQFLIALEEQILEEHDCTELTTYVGIPERVINCLFGMGLQTDRDKKYTVSLKN